MIAIKINSVHKDLIRGEGLNKKYIYKKKIK